MILLVHGWGFDASVWDGVRAALPPDVEVAALDLGFFGAPTEVPAGVTLAVGHSLGALWLLREGIAPVLAVNGFPRFTAAPDFPQGVAPRMVERMARRLADAPAEVVEAFRARCGAAPAPATLNGARLAWGLDLLMSADARPARPLRALAGRNDPIVPPAMTEAAFGAEASWLDGGHLLPLSHPSAVAQAIVEALP